MSQLAVLWHHVEHETNWDIRSARCTSGASTCAGTTRSRPGTGCEGCRRDTTQCSALATGNTAAAQQAEAEFKTSPPSMSFDTATVETPGAGPVRIPAKTISHSG